MMSNVIFAQEDTDTATDTTTDTVVESQDYATSPVFGSSSSRGVSIFSVPGRASIGSTEVRRFAYYATGLDRVRSPRTIYQANPLAYQKRLPISGTGAIPTLNDMVRSRLNEKVTDLKADAYFRDSLHSKSLYSSGQNSGRPDDGKIQSWLLGKGGFYSLRIPKSTKSNALLKQLESDNYNGLSSKNKNLLLDGRSGRLSYSRNTIDKSLANKAGNIYGKRLLNDISISSLLGSN